MSTLEARTTCHAPSFISSRPMKYALATWSMLIGLYSACGNAADDNYLTHPARFEWQPSALFEGVFEDGTPFQVHFQYPRPEVTQGKDWGIQTVHGQYWYPRKFGGRTIAFRMETPRDNAFRMVVMTASKNPKEAETEVFEGTISADRKTASGVWTDLRRMKKLNFSMRRLVDYKRIYLSVPAKVINGLPIDRPFVFDSSFPVFGDPNVNRWIAKFASECSHDMECLNDVDVVWHSKASFSLKASIWGYSHGMAHGNSYTAYAHFINTSSHPIQVALDHFVSTSPDCLGRISNRIIATLSKGEYGRPEDGALTNWKTAKFLPTPQGILFTFDPYEVGAYVDGPAEVFVQRQYLGNCLRYLPSHD